MKIDIKRLAVSIFLIAVIFTAGWVIFDSVFPNTVLRGENLELSAGLHQTFAHDNMALLVGNEGLMVINRRGEVVTNVNERFSFPFASVNGNFILHSGRRSREFVIYRNRREFYRVNANGNIMLGKVNRNGYAAVVTEAMGFNGMVTIYNRRGNPIYQWFVGDGYILDVDISPNNQMFAIAKFSSDGTTVSSSITFVDIARDEVMEVVHRNDSLISALKFNRDGTLLAVSDTELLGFNRDGRLRYYVNFNGRTLSTFNIDSENTVVLAFLAGRGNTAIEIYNRDGRMRGSHLAQGRIRNLTVSGDVILCSRLRTVLRIHPNGRAEELITVPYDIQSLQVLGDRRHVLVVGGTGANVIRF